MCHNFIHIMTFLALEDATSSPTKRTIMGRIPPKRGGDEADARRTFMDATALN